MKKIIISLLVAFSAIFIVACGDNSNNKTTITKEKQTITVGMELSFPPFEMKDAQGKANGISVDIVKAFGESIGKKVIIKDINFEGLIPALKTGKIDMVLSSLSITEDRAKVIDFSNPYAMFTMVALTKKGVKDIESLNNKNHRVVVKAGTTAEVVALHHFANMQHDIVSDMSSAVLEVLQGKADFTFYDALSMYEQYKKYPKQLEIHEYTKERQPIGAGFKKGNKLKDDFNTWLEKTKKGDFFEQESDKYLGDMKTFFSKKGFSFFFDLHKD